MPGYPAKEQPPMAGAPGQPVFAIPVQGVQPQNRFPVVSPIAQEHQPFIQVTGNQNYAVNPGAKPLFDAEATHKAGSGRFVVEKYHDVWASVVFLCIFLSMVVTSVVEIVEMSKAQVNTSSRNAVNEGLSKLLGASLEKLGISMLLCSASTIVVCFILMLLMKVQPKAYIISTNILSILTAAGCAVLIYMRFGVNAIGIVSVLAFLALIKIIILCISWKYIPITSFLLSFATRLVFRYPALLLSSFMGYTAHCFFMAVTVLCLAKVYETQQLRDGSLTTLGGVLCGLITLAWYWYGQIVCNVVHVTVSGVAATVYYLGTCMPSNPTWKSLVRAMTTSFGSICFGSLVVAIFQLIRASLRSMFNNRNNILLLCFDCIMSFIEGLMKWFNTYAFTYIAIYGDSYLNSASKAWNLISNAPCATVFSNNVVGITLNVTSILVSCVTTVIVIYAGNSITLAIICGIWTFIICFLMLRVVNSAVVALFVCVADAPDALQYSEPELHTEISNVVREAF